MFKKKNIENNHIIIILYDYNHYDSGIELEPYLRCIITRTLSFKIHVTFRIFRFSFQIASIYSHLSFFPIVASFVVWFTNEFNERLAPELSAAVWQRFDSLIATGHSVAPVECPDL